MLYFSKSVLHKKIIIRVRLIIKFEIRPVRNRENSINISVESSYLVFIETV